MFGRALPLALLLAAAAPALAESQLATQGSAAARLDFRVVIPVVLKVHALDQPSGLEITEQHLRQGYVDVADASRVRLTSNGRRGFSLAVAWDAALVDRVEVRTPLSDFVAPANGAAIQVPTTRYGEQELPVSYRIHLKTGTRAGLHRWPVGLSFSSISA